MSVGSVPVLNRILCPCVALSAPFAKYIVESVDAAVTAEVACARHTTFVVAKLCPGTTSRDKVRALNRCAGVHPFGYVVGCHIFVNLISQVKPPKILWASVTRAISLCKNFPVSLFVALLAADGLQPASPGVVYLGDAST